MKKKTKSNTGTPFEIAFAKWKAVQATLADMQAHPKGDDACNAAVDAQTLAEWKMIATPSQSKLDLKMRGEATREIMCRALDEGEPRDNRHLLILLSLVAELGLDFNNPMLGP